MEAGRFISVDDCCNKTGVSLECIGSCDPMTCELITSGTPISQKGIPIIGGVCADYYQPILNCCKGIIYNKPWRHILQ